MKTLQEIIENSKKRLMSTFLKIEKNGNTFVIREYVGPKKSLFQMHSEGWNRFDSLLNEINESYPIFNINDFKAVDLNTIVKKSSQDYLQEELMKYIKYFEISENLYNAVKNLKQLLINLSVKYNDYKNFSDVQALLLNSLNTNTLDGSKYLNLFTTYVNTVLLELENLKISNPRNLFNEKFVYFFALIK